MFVRVRMPILNRSGMPLVVEEAIGADQSGRYVLIVNYQNTVEKRNIKTGQLVDGMRVIESGITADDWIVVQGVQRVRTGSKVNPKRIEMTSLQRIANE